ncbi:UNKNOWN [Stylonychia lemnae]|uniref:VTT domain-containing protein n=1 Tax=Stylonychia lemnae TaxID=5949 RepID=A0A078B2W4_STYLE|nr:UNKNOWN [Stylonychia lemnae]|eukprot:CDW87567.1 UNKNOWN [Stylonychia lemnae]
MNREYSLYDDLEQYADTENRGGIVVIPADSLQKLASVQNFDHQSVAHKHSRRKIFNGKVDPLKFTSGLALFLVIIGLLITILMYRQEANLFLEAYIEWIETHQIMGVFVFLIVNIIIVPLMIPGTILAILGSYIYAIIYGKVLGYFVIYFLVVISNTIGAFLSFIISRGLFYECLSPYLHNYRYLRAMNRGIKKHGFKFIFLIRMCPVVPYNVFNYVSAVTDVNLKQYFWGTLFGMMPLKAIEIFIFINITVDISKIIEGKYKLGSIYEIVLIVGVVMAIGLIILIGYVTKKELDKEIQLTRSRERELRESLLDENIEVDNKTDNKL